MQKFLRDHFKPNYLLSFIPSDVIMFVLNRLDYKMLDVEGGGYLIKVKFKLV